MKLDIKVENQATDVVSVTVQGDVTLQTSPALRNQLKPLFTEENKEVHVYLSDVGFMDSSGIATLVEGLQWARNTDGRFVLHALQDNVLDVFNLAKLDTVFEIVEADA